MAWLPVVLDFLIASGSHQAKFFSRMLARDANAIFVSSAVPALVLASLNRWLWLAAILAIWPIFVVGYVVAVITR